MSTQVFVASSAFGLATLVAALDEGVFEPADRRVLVLSNNAAIPETTAAVTDVAGVAELVQRFDAVHDYNAAIAPQHPGQWKPRAEDLPVLERYLSQRWGLEGDLRLVAECIWVAPTLTLARIFPDARIDTYADGLMSYGPTRSTVPTLVSSRVERLLHLDLVPGLTPVLLSEFDVPTQVIPTEAFRKVVATLGPPPAVVADAPAGSVAVLLGQYLAALEIVTPEEEQALQLEMVTGAVAAGFTTLVFKPHPGAPPLLAEPLRAAAAELGAELTVVDDPALVETWFTAPAVGAVVGCFSTAQMTAASCYGLPAARVGTDLLLERLQPYQNSNRIPLTVVDAWLPHVRRLGAGGRAAAPVVEVETLVRAVAYCMQPRRYPELRPDAEALLSTRWPEVRRYFKRRRLGRLDLPGGLAPQPRPLRPASPLRAVGRSVLGPTVSRQAGRLLRRLRSATQG